MHVALDCRARDAATDGPFDQRGNFFRTDGPFIYTFIYIAVTDGPFMQWDLRPERTKIKLRKRLYPLGMTRLTVGADYDPMGGEWR